METIAYGAVRTGLGGFLVAVSRKGVVRIGFPGEKRARFLRELRREFPGARVVADRAAVARPGRALAARLEGRRAAVPLDLRGSAFQRSVWRALQRIPFGGTASYGEVARRVGRPGAARAVGLACNRNPVPILVPCHRVVGSNGALVGFGGGLGLKRRLLAGERNSAR
ncbi:MAG TPA: methylated-DNA--[protein]-cysteine S-methyltransferase [Planctomycetota bacterium]|jgi:O-6-methylguanine DNA methyltransferase|nr:methylated-DNA--[protein]-cysteine S-methyltransferase [Planctomycetota bacterium]